MSHLRIIDVSPESTRLAVLRAYDVLDTAPEKAYDEIVRLASIACEVPCATLTLVDAERAWFKARRGIAFSELPRQESFCNHAFKSSGVFVVADARADERFKHLPLVTEGGIQFYAGVPLLSPEGQPLGVLCVGDHQPRELSPRQLITLRALANHTLTLLERRRQAIAPPSTRRPDFPGSGSVLIVDDDSAVLAFAKIATQRLGYQVFEASNGQEAWDQLNRHAEKIDLVLTDVNMPVMDGLELVRLMKKRPHQPAIIVMSGRFEDYIRAAFEAEEVTNLLGKPFSVDELELTLLQAMSPGR